MKVKLIIIITIKIINDIYNNLYRILFFCTINLKDLKMYKKAEIFIQKFAGKDSRQQKLINMDIFFIFKKNTFYMIVYNFKFT